MTFDEIPEAPYQRKSEPDSPQLRERYWNAAFGLQEVDGLKPSSYARSLARSNAAGEVGLDEVGSLLRDRYRRFEVPSEEPDEPATRAGQREADLVSHRIVEVLEGGAFVLAPQTLALIHRHLFQDLDPDVYQPGTYKTEQLIKPEVVLNGDSVFYAPPGMCAGMLDALFARETCHGYGYDFGADDCANFSTFVARIWQVHPFREGNTRTAAVFAELYLSDLGFSVGNEVFERHARYFRDALVRANYRNRAVRVEFDVSFLERFFDSAVHGTPMEFDRHELLCREMFEHPEALRNATAADAREVRDYLARVHAEGGAL